MNEQPTTRMMPKSLETTAELVRQWADEARAHAALLTELDLWLARRAAVLSHPAWTQEEKARELLVLECGLADRTTVMVMANTERVRA